MTTPSAPQAFSVIFEACQPYALPPPWSFLRTHQDYRCPPNDRAALLAQLTAQFPEDALVQLGIVKRNNDGSIRLCRPLAETQSPILAIRESPTRPISGLIADLRYVGPLLTAGEHLVRVARQQAAPGVTVKQIVLVENMVDAAILASQGIVSVPCPSLARLAPRELREVLDLQYLGSGKQSSVTERRSRQSLYFGEPSGNSASANSEGPTQLVIPVFAATDLGSKLPSADGSLTFVRDLVGHFPTYKLNVGAWRPSEATRAKLILQQRHDLSTNRVRTVLASLQTDCVAVQEIGAPPKTPLDHFHSAIQVLEKLDLRNAADADKSQAFKDLLTHLESTRIQPLRAAAQAAKDPLKRELLCLLADMARVALPQILADSQRLRREAEHRYLFGAGPVREQQLNHLAARTTLQFYEKYLSLLKEVRSCQSSRTRPKPKIPSQTGQIGSRFQRRRLPR